jgi:hypothetical protein
MGLFGRIFGRSAGGGGEARAWREAWSAAVASLDASAVPALEDWLRREPALAEDVEIEEEMLDALRHLLDLQRELDTARLPLIDTSHRVVGGDRCHFSAAVSMPDDPAQPTGRLLLTSTRAVFAGGARTPALPWHAARDVVRAERDLILVRAGADDGYRFRCNSFTDAVCGAAIARELMRRARSARSRVPDAEC